MKPNLPSDDRAWERGWKDHADAQLARLAWLPLSEKLAWLEEAHRVARQLEASHVASVPTSPSKK